MHIFRLILVGCLWLAAFQLSAAAPTPISFGVVVSGNIGEPGEQDAYTFNGVVGQRLFYDALHLDFQGISVQISSPSGSLVLNINHSSDWGPFTLPESGAYQLVVDGSGATTGDYSFKLDDLAASAPLTLGTAITGDLTPRSETDFYKFSGTQGQRIHFHTISSTTSEANWLLIGPANQSLISGNIRSDLTEVVLPVAGVYTLAIDGSVENQSPLAYQVVLTDVTEPPVSPAGLGAILTGAIAAGQRITNSFTAPAGSLVFFDSQDRSTGALVVELRDPLDDQVFFINANADAGPYLLPHSGAYKLIPRGSDNTSTGNYRFRMLDLKNGAQSLSLNTPVSASLDNGLRTEVYQFTGAAGQRLFYDATESDPDNIGVVLFGPNGTPVGGVQFINGNSESDVGPFSLVESGTYYLFLQGNQTTTGGYGFQLIDITAQPVLAYNTVQSGTLTPGVSAHVYRLAGTNGQHVYFSAQGGNNQGFWGLYGPANEGVASAGLNGSFEYTFAKTGTYSLVLSGNSASPVPFSFQVIPSAKPTEPLVLGSTISGNIARSGYQHLYTFDAVAGQRLYFDGLDINQTALRVQLVSPSTGNTFDLYPYQDGGPYALPEQGTYTLVVYSYQGGVGDYHFRLIDLAQPPVIPLALDTTVGLGLIPVPSSFLSVTGSYVNSSLRSYAAQDDWRTSQTIAGTRVDPTINFSTATWGLRSTAGITGGTDAAWENFSVQWDGFVTVTNKDTHLYFSSDDGSRMWIDLNNDGVFDISGSEVSTNGWGVGQGKTLGPPSVNLQPGKYRIRIQYEQGTGDSAAVLLWDGGTSLTPGFRTDVYRFTGVAGQQLYFDHLSDNSSGTWYLYGPSLEQVSGAGLSSDFEVTLSRTGPYLLVLAGQSANPVPVMFRVVTAHTDTTPLTFGAVVRDTLVKPGDQHVYTFQGSIGQRLLYDSLENDFSQIFAKLISPSGSAVFINGYSDSDVAPFTLAEDGTYKLIIDGSADTTGSYAFRLLDLRQPPARVLALDTTIGLGWAPVPASYLSLTGSFVNTSLRGYTNQDDWRTSQTISGTRLEPQLNFDSDGWGNRAAVGLTGGTDAGWDNFSVQWDGIITITNQDTHLYLGSDDGSRMWIDLNHDGVFDSSGPELMDDGWGTAHGVTYTSGSAGLSPGTYRIRIQYEDGSGGNRLFLPWDGGTALSPGLRTDAYRFTGLAGQQLYFHALGPSSAGSWYLYDPGNQQVGGANLAGDFEVTLLRTGEYVLVFYGNALPPAPYAFRVWTVQTPSSPLVLGATVSDTLVDPGDQHSYTFTGTAGQRLYYDGMLGDFDAIYVRLLTPGGTIAFINGNSDSDVGPFTLTEDGTYTLVIDGIGDVVGAYRFRLLDVLKQPQIPLDTVQNGTINPGYSSAIYQVFGQPDEDLYFNALGSASGGGWTLYGPGNERLGGSNLSGDFELTLSRNGSHILVLGGNSADPVPYSLKILTPNDNNSPPSVSIIADQVTTANVAIAPIPFTVGDVETPAASLGLAASSSNPSLVPNNGVALAGTGTSRTVAITPAFNQFGSAFITIKVSDASGAQAISSFVVNVTPTPPRIVQQPQGQTVSLNGNASFVVVADGIGPISYQWRKNGINLPGATAPTLTINGVGVGDAGNYSVVVSNPFGAVNSAIATLVIPVNPLPMTNNFVSRVSVNDISRTGRSSNTGASKEPGEPNHGDKLGGKSMWLTWTAPANGIATFSTKGSTFDTLLGIYTGPSLASLVELAGDDDDGGFFTSEASFNATAGAAYQIAVDGLAGAEGDIILSWNLEITSDSIPQIATQPTNQTVAVGGTAAFTVVAQGQNLTYHWFFAGATIQGASQSSLVLNNVQVSDVGSYYALVSSGSRTVQSDTVALQLSAVEAGGAAQPVSSDDKFADIASGGGGVALQSLERPAVDRWGRGLASVARGFTGSQIFSTVGSAKEQGEPNHCGVAGGASQWFPYSPPAAGVLTFTTDGSDFDTVLAVYTSTSPDFAHLNLVACDNDSGSDGLTSRLSFAAEAGAVYYVAVDGINGASGNVRLNFELVNQQTQNPLAIGSLAAGNPNFGFRVTGLPGRTYTIQGSTNLIDWSPLLQTAAPGGVVDYTDSKSPTFNRRYYRAIIEP